ARPCPCARAILGASPHAEPVCELERERELEAVFLDRVAEELLGACDAVQDRVAVGVEAVCRARSAAAVMQVGAEGLAQGGGPCAGCWPPDLSASADPAATRSGPSPSGSPRRTIAGTSTRERSWSLRAGRVVGRPPERALVRRRG